MVHKELGIDEVKWLYGAKKDLIHWNVFRARTIEEWRGLTSYSGRYGLSQRSTVK